MKMLALAILLLSFPLFSQAKGWDHNRHQRHYEREHNHSSFWHRIDNRRHQQKISVKEGKYHGELTKRELKQLKRERKHLAKQIKHFKRHNHMSRADRRSIREHVAHYDNMIYDLKHNRIRKYRDRHAHHQYGYNNHNTRNTRNNYSYERPFSWANNEYSTGFYFRF